MRVTRLIGLILLLCVTNASFAQSTQLRVFSGYRHDGPGRVIDSNATFALGMTRDGVTYIDSAGLSETVIIRGEVHPEPVHTGQNADIFVVDRILSTGEFRMRTRDGVWVPWNVMVSTLVPFRENVALGDTVPVEMFSGTLGIAGEHRIFIGYRPHVDGVLRYHTSGLPLTITEQSGTPREQAYSLFVSTISPNIVATRCIACHVPGGSAPSVGAYSLRAPPESNLQSNFETFRALVQLRGVAFILSKATGGSNHSGGVQLTAGTAEYRSFENFLNLLAEDLR